MSDYSGKEETLVPGSLIGYRVFHTLNNSDLYQKLMSIMSYYLWNPGINTASCNNNVVHSVVHYDTHYGKYPPVSSCRCGFYAKYFPDDFKDVIGYGWSGPLVLGAIEAHGRVILGTKGFRAEKARIIGLAPFQAIDCSKIPLLANHYRVNYYDHIQDLVNDFPPSDVSNLVPKETSNGPDRFTVITGRQFGKTYSRMIDDMKMLRKTAYEAESCTDLMKTTLERINDKTLENIILKLVINDQS